MYLKPSEIDRIESAANELILQAYEDTPNIALPIDIAKIAASVGLAIKEGNFGREDISGAFDRAAKTIYIASEEPYRRKAFTIAHEIGHYILHKDKENEVFYRSDATAFLKSEKPPEETEADWFAASLLMPRDMVNKYAPFTESLDKLATIFGVSKPAMFFRLKSLGYTGYSLD
jgi:Zn-dependent peptidase ImmA (M78 family)